MIGGLVDIILFFQTLWHKTYQSFINHLDINIKGNAKPTLFIQMKLLKVRK